jgi:hypothetical protein
LVLGSAAPINADFRISIAGAQEILDEVFAQVDSVISHVHSLVPKDFPWHIAETIFDGMRKLKNSENRISQF